MAPRGPAFFGGSCPALFRLSLSCRPLCLVPCRPHAVPFPFGRGRAHPVPGGCCGGVPPLPIPNREVKPASADGTAMQCGRVGRRPLSSPPMRRWPRASSDARGLFLCPCVPWIARHGICSQYCHYRYDNYYSDYKNYSHYSSIIT